MTAVSVEAIIQSMAIGTPILTGIVLFERRLTKVEATLRHLDKTLMAHMKAEESHDDED